MAQRDIDTVFGAKEEWLSSTIPALKELDTALLKVIESFSLAVMQSQELNSAIGAVGKTVEETAQYKKNEDAITALGSEYERLGATTEELLAIKVREFEQQGATIEQAERYMQLLNDIEEKKQAITADRPFATAASDFQKFLKTEGEALTAGSEGHAMYSASLNAMKGVQNAAYQAMEDQLMSFIEAGKFSGSAFAKIIAQQVKVELVGMASIAAVKAIFFTALGFGHLAMGNKPLAFAAFTSAKFWGMVGATSLAAAAGVQSAFFGGVENPRSGATGAGTVGIQRLSAFSTGSGSNLQTLQTQSITIQIYNPLSTQNWAEIAEKNIIPAINDAANRNINIVVKNL